MTIKAQAKIKLTHSNSIFESWQQQLGLAEYVLGRSFFTKKLLNMLNKHSTPNSITDELSAKLPAPEHKK